MKKIFLTSGIVLCMACPAMADLTPLTNGSEQCVSGVLGTSTAGDNVQFQAKWTAHTATISLDSKLYKDGANQTITNGRDAATASSPSPVYTVYGGDIYTDAQRTTPMTGNFSVPVMTGYVFGGFYTEQNGQGSIKINANGTFTKSDITNLVSDDLGSATLYASWTAKTGSITYSCGDKPSAAKNNITAGTLPGNTSLTYDATYDLAPISGNGSTICSLQGWHFTTWDCTGAKSLTDASGAQQDAWDVDTVNAAVTCTPHWVQNNINLHWDIQGGSVETGGAPSCDYDGNVTLPTSPAKTGYTFAGWEVVTYNSEATGKDSATSSN